MTGSVIKSAERVLAILEHFRMTQAPVTVGDLARSLSLPQSSASMLLRSLTTLGYLDYTPRTRSYLPTCRVALLGEWLHTGGGSAGPLTERLEALHRRTGETVILGRQHGAAVQYLHVVQRDQGMQLRLRPGTLRPMTTTALGLMLLAAKPDREARGLIRRTNAETPEPRLRVAEASLMDDLGRFRRAGHAESPGLLTPGAAVLAVLAEDDPAGSPLAIGVGGPADRIGRRRDDILAALRDCAATPGRRLAALKQEDQRHGRRREPGGGLERPSHAGADHDARRGTGFRAP